MADMYEKYVWEVPVRATHWVNALSITVLAVTGIFIGSPTTLAQSTSQYAMGWIRFAHFVAAYAFTVSVLARIYWSFVGNEFASWRKFFPFATAEGRRGMGYAFRYYTFTSRCPPSSVGHNELAATAYSVVFLFYCTMIGTGFALYSERAPHSVMNKLFGWLLLIFSNQGLRLTHHMIMWLLIAFAIHHVYSAWLMDIKERGGVMSSIFGGYKPVHKR